ncbi:MAG: GerMN domain-containing protein [Candidatus Aminicenantes bacterium]|nr:GerMN domain-containing protein [Candidatus Aminicenantes bacterium]
MSKKIIYILVGAAVVFFVISLVIFFKSDSSSRQVKSADAARGEAGTEVVNPEFINVKVFFFTEKSRQMSPVLHEIEFSKTREDLYRKFIELLMKGEINHIAPITAATKLRTLYYIEAENLLVLDFSDELIIDTFPGGSDRELEFIYFFVNNFCYNFKEIKKVMFLAAGNHIKTLSGHIDMENPFYPDFRYIGEE